MDNSTLAFLSASCAAVMALAVVFLERRSRARWFFAIGMALLAVERLFTGFAADAFLPDQAAAWYNRGLVIGAFVPATWLCFSLSYARGDQAQVFARWRWRLAGAFLIPLGIILASRGRFFASFDQPGPDGNWTPHAGASGFFLYLIFLLTTILVLMNLERTYRASVGMMRWRIKFMILGLGVLFVVRAYTSSQTLLSRAADPRLQTVNSIVLLVACLVIVRSLLRAGHFEVDVYPSQSILHSSVTLLLAGAYLIIVGVLAKLFTFLGRGASLPEQAFAVLVLLVILSMVLLSDRVRLYTKRFVSRHFQRPLYDYRTVWRTFTERTARQVEQSELADALVKLVSEIFQAHSVTIWLVDDRKEKLAFAASTSLSPEKAGHFALDPAAAAEVIKALTGQPGPVDIDASKETWASALRRCHPEEFRNAGNRIAVSLAAANELVGILILGERVGGEPLSLQDLDLLKSVSDQAATALLNVQLSHRLSQAKQLEAFQAMSAFFVHDLKNTASTLSLMLQNLPVHYHDASFREDALRGISKTVTHINDIISRLTLLRQELVIDAVECDLNELVADSLDGQAEETGIDLVRELRPLPKVRLDPAQIQKVITNLVLNARQAVGAAGHIRVETSRREGWVVLGVADNGCGMSPEFVERSLFRPFQTTKKNGIGIGMFHCKMIVEAHRGRIEVESALGKGTAFRVLLPLT
jgi:putative PEP-CTERM system histidine kinase